MKIKEILFSEKGMKVVNILFFLSTLFYRSRAILIAYIAWLAYLIYCLKNAKSKESKRIFIVLSCIASLFVLLHLNALIRGL